MTSVVFHAPEGTIDADMGRRVPVSILDGTLELKREITGLGTALELEPGVYVARAILPGGRKLEGAFALAAEAEPVEITLEASGAVAETAQRDAPATFGQKLKTFDPADVARIAGDMMGALQRKRAGAAASWVRIGYGNPFERIRWQLLSKPYAVGEELDVEGPEPTQVVMQLKPSRWQVVAPVLPRIEGQPVDSRRATMVRRQGAAFPHFHFKNADLEMLLRYLAADSQRPVEGLSGEEALVARRAFDDPGFKPLAASAGAYALLRLGRLDELGWTPEMAGRFPWLPDAYAIHGEWRARRGEHDLAHASFLKIPEVGLPYFSMGLSDAVNRLSQYAAADFAHAEERAKVLAKLQEISGRTDFARPITTWRA